MRSAITVTNQKGGIGKSTTVQAIGAGYALKGFRTLLIDTDQQSNLTIATGAIRENGRTVYELLSDQATAEEVIQPIKENLFIIPASKQLAGIAKIMDRAGSAHILEEKLEPILDQFDYIVIDTPPALGDMTVNALTASSRVVVPAQADLFSLEAIKDLAETIAGVKKYVNPNLTVEGILLTRYQPRSILTRELTELIEEDAKALNTKLFISRIREAIAIKEAQVMHEDIFTYAPKSKVANDYRNFFTELTAKEDLRK